MNPSEPKNNLAEKLACDDDLNIEFERIDLNLREIEFDVCPIIFRQPETQIKEIKP